MQAAGGWLVAHTGGHGHPLKKGSVRGWGWLAVGIAVVLLWTHVLSLHGALANRLSWFPSLALLPALRFMWLNRSYRGLCVVAAGVACNLLVMAANGGLMPIAPARLTSTGGMVSGRGAAGAILEHAKDRVLPDGQARLAFLDDRWNVKVGDRHIVASVGDGLVVLGCLLTLVEAVAYREQDTASSLAARARDGMESEVA